MPYRLTKNTVDRCVLAHKMRLEGKGYKEIGEALGVSKATARNIYLKYHRVVREQSAANWHEGLSKPVIDSLIANGYTSKEQVYDAVRTGKIADGEGVLGQEGFVELLDWLDIE